MAASAADVAASAAEASATADSASGGGTAFVIDPHAAEKHGARQPDSRKDRRPAGSVYADAAPGPTLIARSSGADSNQVIDQDGAEHQQDIDGFSPCIE